MKYVTCVYVYVYICIYLCICIYIFIHNTYMYMYKIYLRNVPLTYSQTMKWQNLRLCFLKFYH